MPIGRSAALLLCLSASVALPGCAGPGPTPEPGVSLAGSWKLNHAASDDPQKILDKWRVEAFRMIARAQAAQGNAPPPIPGADTGGAHLGPRPDPLLHSPMAHIVNLLIARGDVLVVRQSPEEIVFDYGATRRSFTPGGHSVVSAEGGVADQTSGWKGKEYRINIKPQNGPQVTETYGLAPGGKQLIDQVHIAPAEFPSVTIKRVYDAAEETPQHQLPVSD
ncbi:MAG TPA: hypothetical protein VEH54_05490 [Steroidobacteraceae bacterium]|nr:hypothetical protein [Steroidobacteraceae bacterium]